MCMDVVSLYSRNMLFPMYVTNGNVKYKLSVKGETKIRIQFINPYYNADVGMFMDVYTSEMLYCMFDVLYLRSSFYAGQTLWQERKR